MDRIELSPRARLNIALTLICLIIVGSFSVIFYGVYQVYYAPASLFSRDFNGPGTAEEFFEQRVINVAVLGLHNREEDNTYGDIYYVDTILVASINFDLDTLTLLAVPRDSYVEIAHSGVQDRIRQSYSYGYKESSNDRHEDGLRFAVDTVSLLLDGIELHYYIAMDIQGLKQLIDSLGGVFYTVEKPMIGYTPQESLDAGPQLLDGQGYLSYLTYREPDARDDLNRIKRQKALLLATFDYFKKMGLFSYVIPSYVAYRENVYTDLNFNQVAALTIFAGERLETDAIGDYSLQGEYFTLDEGETYYLLIDENKKEEILKSMSGVSGGRGY